MSKSAGVIYILTNPSFKEYVKIGYADDIDKRLHRLNSSECTPFAFRVYATYEVGERLEDLELHSMIDSINPNLRSIDNVNGKKRVREFYAMSPETAYSIFRTIAKLSGSMDKLKLYEMSETEQEADKLAEEVKEEHRERLSPFAFSKCNIPVGATIVYTNRGNANSGTECTVADDKNVLYQGEVLSLSALATKLSGSKWTVAGPRFFKYKGEWLCDIRAKLEGRTADLRIDDTWIIPCNPKKYNIVGAFEEFDIIEWSQSTNTMKGDTVYIYVGGNYKSIMYKCEVIDAELYGNRSDADYKYYKDMDKDLDKRYMKLKLVEKYAPDKFPLAELKLHGLTTVQGRSTVTSELVKYLES